MTLEAQTSSQSRMSNSEPVQNELRLPRRSLGWSELLAAPIHDFPIRDQILHQYAAKLPGLKILEVGPGSGFTVYTLLPCIEQMTLVDYAEITLTELREKLGTNEKLRFVQSDISQPGLAARLGETYDFVFGLDMFEYVTDRERGLENLAAVTSPNGVMFLTFPNFAPPRGDGNTWYLHRCELEDSLRRAGFRRWEILCVALKPYASAIFTLMHEWPLKLYRYVRKQDKSGQPQTYEGTWAFQNRDKLQRMRSLLNIYWAILGAVLRLGGEPFQATPAPEDLLSLQLVVLGWK
jgi:ubiquinone/menaquinone biosynthesis C-methylase UbiE